MVSPAPAGSARHITLQVGDTFVVSGTDLACAAQVGKKVIKGQKLVACFKAKHGTLAAHTYVAALGANGRVVVGSVKTDGSIGAAVFDRKPTVRRSATRQFTVHAGDQLLLSGTDVACAINNDISGVYPTCFRVRAKGGLPGSYAFAETEKFVAVVQFDSTGKKTKVVFKREYGH